MIRKDYVLFEIEKIAHALAHILGLKKEGKIDLAQELADQALNDHFGLTADALKALTPESLDETLHTPAQQPEKLQLFADLLFESVHPFEDTDDTMTRLHLVLAVQNALEEHHHVSSLGNLARRELIDHFLNNRQYE